MTPAQLRAIEARIQAEREQRYADPKSIPRDVGNTVHLTEAEREEAVRLRDAGMTFQRIADVFGCDPSAVHRIVSQSRGSR
jgi:predicted DNA-binding protein (UPF0251 family)